MPKSLNVTKYPNYAQHTTCMLKFLDQNFMSYRDFATVRQVPSAMFRWPTKLDLKFSTRYENTRD